MLIPPCPSTTLMAIFIYSSISSEKCKWKRTCIALEHAKEFIAVLQSWTVLQSASLLRNPRIRKSETNFSPRKIYNVRQVTRAESKQDKHLALLPKRTAVIFNSLSGYLGKNWYSSNRLCSMHAKIAFSRLQMFEDNYNPTEYITN